MTRHPADIATERPTADRTEADWVAIREVVQNAVDYVIADCPAFLPVYRDREDIAQGIMLRLWTRTTPSRYSPAKTSRNYSPQCWGHYIMVAKCAVINHVVKATAMKRDARKTGDFGEWHRGGGDVETSLDLALLIDHDAINLITGGQYAKRR